MSRITKNDEAFVYLYREERELSGQMRNLKALSDTLKNLNTYYLKHIPSIRDAEVRELAQGVLNFRENGDKVSSHMAALESRLKMLNELIQAYNDGEDVVQRRLEL